jgi:hypothetical protein
MSQGTSHQPYLDRLQWLSLVAGIVGLALCALGVGLNPTQFFRSYLLAYVFWIGLTLGCMAVLMVHHLAGGSWGALLRRTLESGVRTLPLMAVFFVPLLFGLQNLYSWARPEAVARDALLQHKSLYLNVPFFGIRLALYFVAWLALAFLLAWWSRQEEQTPEWRAREAIQRRLGLLSGVGLLLYGLTMTFAAVDWVMSLDPHWYSTIFGILVLVGQLLGALAFGVVVITSLARFEPLAGAISADHLHDLGNLLLTSVLFWAYISFSQLLIIWSGNLPEGIVWYRHRLQGGWEWVGVALALFQFALPFLLLLSSDLKRVPGRLGIIAAAIFCMHLVDVFWIIMPAFYREGPYLHWLDVAALIGIGGVWIAVFAWQLKGRALLPMHDLALQGVPEHG